MSNDTLACVGFTIIHANTNESFIILCLIPLYRVFDMQINQHKGKRR